MGNKSNELLKKLQGGLPVTEAPVLLREVEEERAREQAPKVNPHQYQDAHVQQLSDLWFSQRATATVEQKNKVGLAYISKVLGLGDNAARRFAQGDMNIIHQVGMRQGGAENYNPDLAGFWTRVQEILPEIHSNEDISFLVERGGVQATWHFLWQLEIPLAEESPVLKALSINAHVYK